MTKEIEDLYQQLCALVDKYNFDDESKNIIEQVSKQLYHLNNFESYVRSNDINIWNEFILHTYGD